MHHSLHVSGRYRLLCIEAVVAIHRCAELLLLHQPKVIGSLLFKHLLLLKKLPLLYLDPVVNSRESWLHVIRVVLQTNWALFIGLKLFVLGIQVLVRCFILKLLTPS